jgi:putative transposase
MKKQHVQLNEADRNDLKALVAQGQGSVRVLKRALALLALDQGATLEAVAQHQRVTNDTVAHWRNAYQRQGLTCLHEAMRSGRPKAIDGSQRAQITALACSAAPPGYSQWSLRLLAERVVELGYCEAISHTQVGEILKKTPCSRI